MIPPRTSRNIRTSRHIRTMRSVPSISGTTWQRLRETEGIQRNLLRLGETEGIKRNLLRLGETEGIQRDLLRLKPKIQLDIPQLKSLRKNHGTERERTGRNHPH